MRSAISIKNTGLIMPNEDFEKHIQKIKNLKLDKHIPSDEVHEYIKQTLIQYKCSVDSIKEFFRWSLL